MCYLIREKQAEAAERGGAALPPSFDRIRPRWAGAVAAVLVAGVAVAALINQPASAPSLSAKDEATAAPLASSVVAVPAAAAVDTAAKASPSGGQGSMPVDDGVPSATDVVKAGIGNCEHGL